MHSNTTLFARWVSNVPSAMRMSQRGVEMLARFELEPDYARRLGIGQFDAQGNLTGIYPHYVMRPNVNTGAIESDGGITFGFGFFVNQALFNQSVQARELVNRLAPNASFVPAHTNRTHRVPGSRAMSMDEARELLHASLPNFGNAVNAFLNLHNVTVNQHQFDVLVSFTYNFGANTWTRADRQHWYINQLIRSGPPFIPGPEQPPFPVRTVRHAFSTFNQNENRREAEGEIFINGHC